MNSTLFDMEMRRLDSEIEKTRRKFYSAVLGKKRRVKRSWLEINTLTNAHLLQTLPYRAMLGHVAKVAEDRDKVIREILAAKESSQNEEVDNTDDSDQVLAITENEPIESPEVTTPESEFTPSTSLETETDEKLHSNEDIISG